MFPQVGHQAGAQSQRGGAVHRGPPGGLHQDQRQSAESQTSCREKMVLPGQTGN